MKTILITGGGGFIGSHLCEFLLNKGHKVICVDNFFTGQKRNIEHLKENSHFSVIEHDITLPLEIKEAVDEIYNLACPASPIHYQYDAIKTVKANTIGVINMLELAKKHGAIILQASTSEVYGDPLEHPQKESYFGNVSTLGPRACYDEGKRVAETLMMDYHRQHNVDIRIVRIFNTYGPRMSKDDGRVISNFIIQTLNNKPITIYGEGKQTRSFCYISDLILGMYAMMNGEHQGPINIGNPTEYTILELATKIKELTNSHSEIMFKPLPQDDPIRRKPDISLAKKELQWEPQVSLNNGLLKTIDYFTTISKN